mgnify:CR=1 FL=1
MDALNALMESLERNVRPATKPVGVKLAKAGETPPEKAKSPRATFKKRFAVCQGMTLARTFEWTMVFTADDHACPFGSIFMGHIQPDGLLSGSVSGYYQDDPEVGKLMESTYPRHPEGQYDQVWLAPLTRCDFTPDLVAVYGTPAQILTLIHGANFGVGAGVKSTSTGRFGCSAWLAGVLASGECTYMVPGPGERMFAGTQDHEMSFIIPASKFKAVAEGLDYVRSKGAFRYPILNMGLMSEPALPANYVALFGERDK